MLLFAVAVAAAVVGLVLDRLAVPGGLILGSMLGAAVVSLVSGAEITMPPAIEKAAFIAVGAAIGVTITRSALGALAKVLVPAVVAAVLIILAGVAISYALRLVGLAPASDVLATSPGALSVMSAAAAERGTGAAEVAVFHLVRIVLVILSLPVVLGLFTDS